MELGFYFAHFIRESRMFAEGSILFFTSRVASCSNINLVTVTKQFKDITKTSTSPSITPSQTVTSALVDKML